MEGGQTEQKSPFWGHSADEISELAGQPGRISAVAGDGDTRVVAGNRAHDPRVLQPVVRTRDRRRRAEL
jgi:hypothetical protein